MGLDCSVVTITSLSVFMFVCENNWSVDAAAVVVGMWAACFGMGGSEFTLADVLLFLLSSVLCNCPLRLPFVKLKRYLL